MSNWTRTIERYLAENRSVSGGKGDKTLQSQETAQSNFSYKLMNAFKTQFAAQKGVLDFLTGKLQEGVSNPQGFSDKQIAGLNTQAIGNTASAYQNALKAQQAQSATHGGAGLPSGVEAQIEGQLGGAAAGMQSSQLNDIQLASENQRQNNYWKSVQGLSGTANMMNPLGYAGGAQSGGSTVAGLGEAYKQSQSSQLLGALGGIVGGGLSGWAQGGFKTHQ